MTNFAQARAEEQHTSAEPEPTRAVPEPVPAVPEPTRAEPVTEHPEITYIGCARCGTQIAGLDGRYACSGCGWVNEWTEGHRPLPAAGRRRAPAAPRPRQL
ncbi:MULTISPECIES: hypothetical protein [unclassified Streptomyces]|uniref:hypothetical protein n=1 Tax=unclassified Streptomyces TaxID=2593676 RepID=UPI00344E4876